jgi:protein-S-isoprenylcysteine O-methyltransferase Ste14
MLLATAIVSGNATFFAAWVIVFIFIAFKAGMEERLMTQHFPDAYPDYRRRAKGLVPFVL